MGMSLPVIPTQDGPVRITVSKAATTINKQAMLNSDKNADECDARKV